MNKRAPGKPSKPPLQLPFRLKVPERNELIAFALATLAVGLMVGLAIGPMISGTASPITLLIPGTATEEGDAEVTTTTALVPPLGSPAGSAGGNQSGGVETTVVSDPAPVVEEEPSSETPVEEPVEEDPPATPAAVPDKQEPEPDPDPEPEPEGVLLEGTVLANSPSTKTYWVNSDGDLVTIFAATVPDPALVVSTRVLPLSNGTLTESDGRSAIDIAKTSQLKAVVSYVDPIAGLVVLSGRGASLPVYAQDPSSLSGVEPGATVDAGLRLDVPDPENFVSRAGVEPAELPIQLESIETLTSSGEVEISGRLVSVDIEKSQISMVVDSTGQIDSTVELQVPSDFPFDSFKVGNSYSATAIRVDNMLQLNGFSPANGKSAANDPARAFGTHAL